jgi:mutual gliding-motility protein MglA
MLEFNAKTGVMTWKIVYYGPALSGKSTNLLTLHDLIPESKKGTMMQAETKQDRTLFFDLMPLAFRTRAGARLKIKLFTVPGQAQYNATRKSVLMKSDGVVFVADSQKSQTLHNSESFSDLEENIYQVGLKLEKMPLVVQFNKRDLPAEAIQDEPAVLSKWERSGVPVCFASAMYGKGVRATFNAIISQVCRSMEIQYDINKKFGINSQDLIEHLNPDPAPTAVAASAGGAEIGLGKNY